MPPQLTLEDDEHTDSRAQLEAVDQEIASHRRHVGKHEREIERHERAISSLEERRLELQHKLASEIARGSR